MRKLYIFFLLLLVPLVAKADFPDFDVIPRGDGGKVNIRSITSGGTSTVAIEVDPTADTVTVNKTMTAVNDVDPHNYIINGNFDYWQRGTSFTSGSIGPDRWTLSFSGATVTFSRQSLTLVSGMFGDTPYYANVNCTGANDNWGIYQKIENAATLAGETITFSFWGRTSSGTEVISVDFDQDFGSGGSTKVSTTGDDFTFTTTWQLFSVTVDLPSVVGKTIGTDNFLTAGFIHKANDTGNFQVSQIMLNKGGKAYPFVRHGKSLASELAACQRYYQKSYPVDTAPDTSLAGGSFQSNIIRDLSNQNYYSIRFPVIMRAAPTAIIYSTAGSGGNNQYYNVTDANTLGGSPVDSNTSGFSWRPNAGTNQNIGDHVRCHWTAEAEL